MKNIDILSKGIVLFELEVDLRETTVFVGDRAFVEGVFESNHNGIVPSCFVSEDVLEGEERFMNSLTPLQKYLERVSNEVEGFSLPEVLILDKVPLERVRVSEEQPFLEKMLERGTKGLYIAALIDRGYLREDLLPWRTRYEVLNGPVMKVFRGIEV